MNETAQKALQRLRENTGLKGKWRRAPHLDGQIDMVLEKGNQRFFVDVKRELRPYQVPELEHLALQYPPLLVVANHIFPAVKEILRTKKINYLDGAGNVFIQTEGTYIWIDGQKPLPEEKSIPNRAFTKTGLRVVFYLLLHPRAINLPYRVLADQTGTALGNVANVLNGLKEAGFVLPVNNRQVVLKNKKELLRRWVDGYRETLKPALFKGAYNFWREDDFNKWQHLPLPGTDTVWGGEGVAGEWTRYLKPGKLTLYTAKERGPLIIKWKLVPAEEGQLLLYEKFWKEPAPDHLAPPLLVYADLLLTDDPRCIETAEMIYKQYLQHEME